MKRVLIVAAILVSQLGHSQLNFSFGGFVGNQDNDNPITSKEITTWDGYKPGLGFKHWMTDEQMEEFKDRTEGILYGYNASIGMNVPIVKYNMQGKEMSSGLSTSAQVFIQNSNENYWDWNASYSAGIYVDLGFRVDAGIQNYFNNQWGKYIDVSANVIKNKVRVFARYQTGNPFTNDIKSVFIDGTGITKESMTAGVRIVL